MPFGSVHFTSCPVLSSAVGFLIDAIPGGLVGFIEFVLHLLDAIPSRDQQAGQNEGIRFVLGSLEFLAGFLLEA